MFYLFEPIEEVEIENDDTDLNVKIKARLSLWESSRYLAQCLNLLHSE